MNLNRSKGLVGFFVSVLMSTFFIFYTANAGETGGTHGGGGTLDPEANVEIAFLAAEIPKMKPFLQMAFNFFEYLAYFHDVKPSDSPPPAIVAIQRMFPYYEEIFQRIPKINFDIQLKYACKDKDGKDVDASIYSATLVDPNVICISANTLSGKLTYNNYFASVVGLLAHEISHWYGANEEEAKGIESILRNSIDTSHRYGSFLSDYKYEVNDMIENLERLIRIVDSGPEGKICLALNTIGSELSNLSPYPSRGGSNGLIVVSSYPVNQSLVSTMRMGLAVGFCLEHNDVDFKEMLKEFGGRYELKFSELEKDEVIFSKIHDLVWLVKPHDRQQLKMVLNSVLKQLKYIKSEADRVLKIEMLTEN